MDRPDQVLGTTIVELMVTVSVISILATIAIPNLVAIRRDAARVATVNGFVHSLHLARSEAIKRRSVVSICRSTDGINCANAAANWNAGWIVFVNSDRDQPADTDAGEPILYRHGAIAGGTLTSNRKSFSYRPDLQSDVNGTVLYCPQPKSKDGRAIIISLAGRPRTSNRDASGKPIAC
jgi:type IV fimbrial biogenesis protein FimT